MARKERYFAIRVGPIGYAESYPAVCVNGREVMRAIPSGPDLSFYDHRVISQIVNFCEYHNVEKIGPELYADAVFLATSKSALRKALSEHYAGIKLDQIREVI